MSAPLRLTPDELEALVETPGKDLDEATALATVAAPVAVVRLWSVSPEKGSLHQAWCGPGLSAVRCTSARTPTSSVPC